MWPLDHRGRILLQYLKGEIEFARWGGYVNKGISIWIATAAAIFMAFASLEAQAANVTPAQRAKHPCLDKVAGAAEESHLALSDVPEQLKGLSPVYAGQWNEPNGSKVCSVLIITSINARGQGAALYTNDEPYKRIHSMGLSVKREGNRFLLDVYHRTQGWSVEYFSEDDGKTMVMRPAQGYSGPAKDGELMRVE